MPLRSLSSKSLTTLASAILLVAVAFVDLLAVSLPSMPGISLSSSSALSRQHTHTTRCKELSGAIFLLFCGRSDCSFLHTRQHHSCAQLTVVVVKKMAAVSFVVFCSSIHSHSVTPSVSQWQGLFPDSEYVSLPFQEVRRSFLKIHSFARVECLARRHSETQQCTSLLVGSSSRRANSCAPWYVVPCPFSGRRDADYGHERKCACKTCLSSLTAYLPVHECAVINGTNSIRGLSKFHWPGFSPVYLVASKHCLVHAGCLDCCGWECSYLYPQSP